MTGFPNLDVFFGKLPKGGGVISDPKNYIADFFGFKTVYFGRKFWKKCPKRGGGGGVISNPKNFIANLRKLTHIYELSQKKAQCNFQKWGGGGSKAVWEFSKKTSSLGNPVTPKLQMCGHISYWMSDDLICGSRYSGIQ